MATARIRVFRQIPRTSPLLSLAVACVLGLEDSPRHYETSWDAVMEDVRAWSLAPEPTLRKRRWTRADRFYAHLPECVYARKGSPATHLRADPVDWCNALLLTAKEEE